MNCYTCEIVVTEVKQNGKSDSLGRRVVPTKNYSSVDVHISNGKSVVAYATPVCKSCCLKLTGLLSRFNKKLKVKLFNKVVQEIKKHDFGPRYITDSKNLSLVCIKDLTKELIENEVICR